MISNQAPGLASGYHLSAYLQAHHKQTYARIVREIVADLPHPTTPELGSHAFGRRQQG
jgi:hypothetical protein